MNIHIAGTDRTEELGRQVAEAAARLKADPPVVPLWPGHSALSLKQSKDDADYLCRLIDLLRLRHGIRLGRFHIARAPGLRGRLSLAWKTLMWRLLRYQHERIAFQQNLVNELAISALEFQRDQRTRDLAEVRRRLDRLEQSRGEGKSP